MEGYWQRPDATHEMLRIDQNGKNSLYTGDLGYLDRDGYVFIVDRKKELIKTSGFQVWPREVEEVLAAHPAVAEAGVVGLPDTEKGERVKAWVVMRPGMTTTEAELKGFCRERAAPYKCPSQIEFVSDLPKTLVGKVLRRALKERELEKLGTSPRPVPAT
jgi:long-chain acyl-CoA synthetase